MKPLYIFDLDGTLALTEHRQHILDNKDDPQRWRRFYAACDRDEPNAPAGSLLMNHDDDFDAARGIVMGVVLSLGLVFGCALLGHLIASWGGA